MQAICRADHAGLRGPLYCDRCFVFSLAALHLCQRQALGLLVYLLGPKPGRLSQLSGRAGCLSGDSLLEIVRLCLAELGAFDDHEVMTLGYAVADAHLDLAHSSLKRRANMGHGFGIEGNPRWSRERWPKVPQR